MSHPVEVPQEHVRRFMALFPGFDEAFGTGKGEWIKRQAVYHDFERHLMGLGTGIGIPPLRRDGTVSFAAIDLDEPDFDAARAMQEYIPGRSWLERSRSGNAHVWVFFREPIEAWVPRGILKEACLAAGKAGVEVFPKQDGWHEGLRYGSYINLPFHGHDRPIFPANERPDFTLAMFLDDAEETLSDPADWHKRAQWLMLSPPGERTRTREFGTATELHMCAEHIIAMRDEQPVTEGHRASVFFALAKMLANYEGFDDEEAMHMMQLVNDASPDPIPGFELKRIYSNARRGKFTSTGCDDPLVQPYAHPDCPIANGR